MSWWHLKKIEIACRFRFWMHFASCRELQIHSKSRTVEVPLQCRYVYGGMTMKFKLPANCPFLKFHGISENFTKNQGSCHFPRNSGSATGSCRQAYSFKLLPTESFVFSNGTENIDLQSVIGKNDSRIRLWVQKSTINPQHILDRSMFTLPIGHLTYKRNHKLQRYLHIITA